MLTIPKVKEIHWVKASPREVYDCGSGDALNAPKNWHLDEPHPWILVIPEIDNVETAFAYSRTSDTFIPNDLKEVRLGHSAHKNEKCCIDRDGVVQHAPEERVEVVISDFLSLVSKKKSQGEKRGRSFICDRESDVFMLELLLRLKNQFKGEYLFRKKKNGF
jgi:hypothetical protein